MSKTHVLIVGCLILLASCQMPTDPNPFPAGTTFGNGSNPNADNPDTPTGGVAIPRIPTKPVKEQ